MNIFVTEADPVLAARGLPDRHIVKMPVESVQMLVSACLRNGIQPDVTTKAGGQHRGGYPHHPCTRWVGGSLCNAVWTHQWGKALCAEYTHRYGRVHFAQGQLDQLQPHLLHLPNHPVTPFVRAMPDYLRNDSTIDTITAYRRYLRDHKPWASWHRAPSRKPDWWTHA